MGHVALSVQEQCVRSDARKVPLHRDRHWDRAGRRQKKLLGPKSWYRPANALGFFLVTPGCELASKIQNIANEEGEILSLNIKIIETGGISLRSH